MPLDNIKMPSSLEVKKTNDRSPIRLQDTRVILLSGASVKQGEKIYKTQEDVMIYLADVSVI